MADDDWPFDQPRNCAVFTLRSIVFQGAPILYVSHDADDYWQFLEGPSVDLLKVELASLDTIVRQDSSVLELADRPPGWTATRATLASPWKLERKEESCIEQV
jgi:hypothetical protein